MGKYSLVCLVLLSPAILSFKLNANTDSSELARQFNDDPLINYGIWGFIAGLTDYFVRNGFTTTTTTTTTTPAPATRRTASKVNFRKKQQDKKQKQEKKEKKRLEREEKKQKKKAEKEMENMKEQEEKKEVLSCLLMKPRSLPLKRLLRPRLTRIMKQ